jgi:hypothetical protein
MILPDRFRVAVPDHSEVLHTVRAEVESAVGCQVSPEFQEAERGALVIEMRLAEPAGPDPRQLARAIERSNQDIDVLSYWRDKAPSRPASSTPIHAVLPAHAPELPEVARRALRDDLPTAAWPASLAIGPVRPPAWLLAVPVTASDGTGLVGISQRSGYSHRFTAADAASMRLELAS